jgi:pyruvate dehydrogenase E2 component (dihydrolipoamide acetyltransferase)
MEIEIKLPELGDGIKSGDITEVLIKVGDEVKKGQDVLEVETDKASTTVPSSHSGRVVRLLVKAGDTLPIGGPIAVLEAASGATPAPKAAAPSPAAAAAPAAAAPVAVSPPKPASAPAVAASAPSIAAAPVAVPAVAIPAVAIPAVAIPAVAVPAVAAASASLATAILPTASPGLIPAGPAVRRFAREVGIDLTMVRGTAEGGRITRDDVLDAVRQANQMVRGGGLAVAKAGGAPSTGVAGGTAGDGTSDAWGPVRIERMTKIRKTIAAKMHESWSTVPRVTNMDDADVTELERIRQSSKDDYAARGIKLTQLPFVIKAVAMALKKNPVVNASIDMDNGTIIYKDYVHVGIAVDSDRGLVVPSLRNADQLSIAEIARQVSTLADKVRDNQFSIDELRGSTFTISNLGAVGGAYATPIINTPEVAILLLGRSRKMPVVVNDQIVPRLMMPLSLSYDHRLVDGGAAARFLNDIIGYLKSPGRLLLAP